MKKISRNLSVNDEVKLHFGCAPFPTYHKVLSVCEDGDKIKVEVSMPYGAETLKFEEDEEVEVGDR